MSHWYLPGHFLMGAALGSLPGVERLAQEVFQFWVDDRTSLEEISGSLGAVVDAVRWRAALGQRPAG